MKTRTELIRALVEPELQAQLLRAAAEQDRSLSYTVHEILAEWAQQQSAAGPGGSMTEEHMTATEVVQFRAEGLRLHAEAEALRKQAAEDRAAAEYERGQAQHRLNTVQATEAGISARERKLVELQEPAFLEREAAAAKALADAKALMASYQRDKHAAAIALQQIDARERKQSAA